MGTFVAITDEQLRGELSQVADDPTAANTFFGRFLYVQELIGGNYCAAFDHGMQLLYRCQSLAPDAYAKVHKGTPFYWLGTAAFQKHDYEIAVFFFDAAVSEDLRINAHPIHNSTPSFRFIQVEGGESEQAARSLVQETQKKLEEVINTYNSLPGRPAGVAELQMSEVRNSFLQRAVLPEERD
ncbi:MAG TPA: hypothetical protein VFV92_02375 [Candidatus Bathyarchaeia archaeon]|nr:hypothetical protein [Candidatus Bathyarchaeia archaeon]